MARKSAQGFFSSGETVSKLSSMTSVWAAAMSCLSACSFGSVASFVRLESPNCVAISLRSVGCVKSARFSALQGSAPSEWKSRRRYAQEPKL